MPRWDLDPAPLASGEGGGVLLQYPQAIPAMLPVEVVTEADPSKGRPRATWEGALALGGALQKADIKPVGQVLCLTDRQQVTVDLWLYLMN